ncbi:hypothetical protein JA1_004075 [Spathaspora sp. JA1]|nr:hypothetical protein JA1_004075 [Spathaspora sp. JA1]
MLKVARVVYRHFRVRYISTTTVVDFLERNPITYQTIPQLEPILSKLSTNDQISLVKQYPYLINVQFRTLLRHSSSYDTFQFIVEHNDELYPELIQIYIHNLLCNNQVMATVTLLHKLFDNAKFQLSNELWSMLVSKTCETSSHFGAIFIYHNLINNYKFYTDEPTTYVRENNLIPFLVTVETIEALAIIFTNNKDVSRLEGMFEYYRRFYSFAYNKKAFKSLMILLIEVYSEVGLAPALAKFNQLSAAHDYKPSERSSNSTSSGASNSPTTTSQKSLAIARKVNDNARIRFLNIMNNEHVYTTLEEVDTIDNSLKTPLDIHQELVAKLNNVVELYNPMIQRNLYSRDYGHTKTPQLLNGSICLSDLPNFRALISNHVQILLQESSNIVSELVSMCKATHVNICMFIIASLCDSRRFDLILPFVHELTRQRMKRHEIIINKEILMYILDKCEPDKEQIKFLHSLYDYHVRVNSNTPDLSFLYKIINTMLLIPSISRYDLEKYIKTYSMYYPKLQLERIQYEKIQTIQGLELYKSFISCK